MTSGTFEAVIFDAEGYAARVETDKSAVGNGHPVGVARQIRQHGFGPGEGFLGVDDPVDFAQWRKESAEGISIGEVSVIAEEAQLPGFVQLGQPFQNETAIQTGQHADG